MASVTQDSFSVIGQPLQRKEDQRLITGQGRFTDDFNWPRQAIAVMVRSPYPHARIRSIDTKAARAMPGVLGVFTGQDAATDGLGPIPHDPVPKTKFDMKLTGPSGSKIFTDPHRLLPADKARHVGEAVAMVVAETDAQAQDAAAAVIVDYEELPFVLDQRDAVKSDAPVLWDEHGSNVFVDTWFGDKAATDAAFAKADHVVRMDFHIPRVTAVTMEPRSALGAYDAKSNTYELVVGGGGAVRQKNEISKVLGVAPETIRVMTYDVGGNFGAKNRVYVEYGLVLWASRHIGRPVKFTATRSECFTTDYQGRDLVTSVELALRKDGRFLALRCDNISNVGAHCVSLSPLGKGSGLITGSYDIPIATLHARAVFTNTMSTQAYRSSGRPEVNFAIERIIDTAARELGFDRIALRRKNLVRRKAMPYTNAVGATYDSGDYEAQLNLSLDISDWKGFAKRKREAAKRGKLLGQGLGHYVESSIGTPKERAEITVLPEGRVRVVIGTQPSGQGHETSFSQVIADLLHVPVNLIDIVMGDTKIVRLGGGTHSGRSMRHAGTVMSKASAELIDKAEAVFAHLHAIPAETVAFEDGRFGAPATNQSLDFLELAREAAKHKLPAPLTDGLAVVTDNEMHEPVFPNGCASCEVEVDPETGWIDITRYSAVDDVGRCINPLIVHGQTHGGIAQGVGQAMWELCYLDPTSGQPLAGSFMDYGMPRADNMPSFRTEIAEVLSPTNPLGIKAGGEGGTTPALSVIVNALVDALKDYGVRDIQMPTTPQRIWRLIHDAASTPHKSV
ncbi:MAG TPA: xanthine dehydrogenase family protein molybdopterin-binding subunit [Beijerinckiaceae bacterium]|jgi:carbon-monoxide dehydrogenase large subunit|nr:xanthine dehydrogenase family protein molybdopterin-binding subunit [Beijerinckiaceae bacterium]